MCSIRINTKNHLTKELLFEYKTQPETTVKCQFYLFVYIQFAYNINLLFKSKQVATIILH